MVLISALSCRQADNGGVDDASKNYQPAEYPLEVKILKYCPNSE